MVNLQNASPNTQQPTPPDYNSVHHRPPPPASRMPQDQSQSRRVTVQAVPAVSIQQNRLVVGNGQTSSHRSWTPLKALGDGSFGTVWLCDWHGTLPPNTPLSPMQCGQGAKPEWTGKRLVAVKCMRRQWSGWDECKKLKELESLRAIPFHPNIIPLYDFFLLPDTRQLYFVFESMEGNLYQLIRTRKGRALAGGLVSSIFLQIVAGLYHVHQAGYFHRDMKPENVLVTTTGLFDYNPVSHGVSVQNDVVTIIKLADFGLAREIQSRPPYTEYVSTRWYRAPEVLLRSREYSTPVDMWALGTIMVELVTLKPLFPGTNHIDQVARICEMLGDPSDEYGFDRYGKPLGGGKWNRGIRLARGIGCAFPKVHPRDMYALFDPTVPLSLVQCIIDLLRYDPEARLTSRQCFDHPYLRDTVPLNNIPLPPGIQSAPYPPPHSKAAAPAHLPSPVSTREFPHATSNRPIHPNVYTPPPSHLNSPQGIDSSSSHRTSFYPEPQHHHANPQSHAWTTATDAQSNDYPMDTSYEYSEVGPGPSVTLPQTPTRSHTHRQHHPPDQDASSHPTKVSKSIFAKKSGKWSLGTMFGGDKSNQQPNGLPVVEEHMIASGSTSSLKRTKSNSSDIKPGESSADIQKMNKKEAERMAKEAEMQRRKRAAKSQQDQARAVMQKRKMIPEASKSDMIEWQSGLNGYVKSKPSWDAKGKSKQVATGPIRQGGHAQLVNGISTLDAASGIYHNQDHLAIDWKRETERVAKRRREFDDDHSSSDARSVGHVSTISFATVDTVDSDPGPSRIRKTPSSMSRMTSTSSLRTDDYNSVRSSHSYSLDGQLATEFRLRAAVDPYGGTLSPPPMHSLSLSATNSPTSSPAQPWMQDPSLRKQQLALHPVPPHNASPTISPQSAINPIFKVPPLNAPTSLPPFSQLEAVAEGDYPPLSPMSFHSPDED